MIARLAAGVALLAAPLLSACGEPSTQSADTRSTRISAPAKARDYKHPIFKAANRLMIPGCCSFAVGDAKVDELNGDVIGRLVRGPNFEIEISFGTRLAPLNPAYRVASTNRVDGVAVERLLNKDQPGIRAVIPLSAKAEFSRIDRPTLQVTTNCSQDGCRRAIVILSSVRF